ncbi:MAG: transglutaminase family protein [Alphaproteobacteria bacterium]
MQRLTVDHRTTYHYARRVAFGDHRLMFRPRDSHDLRLIDASLTISPPGEVRWYHDVFSNSVTVVRPGSPSDMLSFKSVIVIERYPAANIDFKIEPFAQTLPFSYPASEIPDLGRTIERQYPEQEHGITEWTSRFLKPTGLTDTQEFLIGVTEGIKDTFQYEARDDPGTRTPAQTLELGSGSCRDFALFMMEAVRSVGLAARFVSGYLYDPSLDGAGNAMVGAGATHAWMQVYLPGAGWQEFDPTNGIIGGANLIPVAVVREPGQAVPVQGTFDGTQTDFLNMEVDVRVTAGQ